jgi:TonB family protein
MRLVPIAVLLLAACNAETPATETTDAHTPIAVEYVRKSTLKIHAKPSDASPVVTTWQHGESVSILSRRGDWTEVRLADGSGWVHSAELAGAAKATKEADNTKHHFVRAPETTDRRPSIAVEYVRESTLKIHARPSNDAPVVTTWQHGEAVSVLSRRGDWTEVRLADGSGWVHGTELAGAAEATKEADNTEPHFIRAPEPVTQIGVHGDLTLEANVNTDGVVTSVRVLRNTTGSEALEQRNIAALQRATFRPMVRHGKREAFVYENRVEY